MAGVTKRMLDSKQGMLNSEGCTVTSTITETYSYDANKNITDYVDSNGSVVAHYEYSPFGQITSATGSLKNDFEYRFSSEYADNETGFVYYNFRYYSPKLGRWLSRDPIEEKGGLNLYVFVGNNSVSRMDKLGLKFHAPAGMPIKWRKGVIYWGRWKLVKSSPTYCIANGPGCSCEAERKGTQDKEHYVYRSKVVRYFLVKKGGRKMIIPITSGGGYQWEKYGVKKLKQKKKKDFPIPLATVEPFGGTRACKLKNLKNKVCPATCSSWVSGL